MNNKLCVSTWFLEATLSCKTTAFNYIRDWVEGTVPLLKSLFHNIICPRLHHDLHYQRELNQHRPDKFLLASHLTNLQPSIDPWKRSKFQGAESQSSSIPPRISLTKTATIETRRSKIKVPNAKFLRGFDSGGEHDEAMRWWRTRRA